MATATILQSMKPGFSAIRRRFCRSTPWRNCARISNYEAEYGRNSGAVVNIVTKSGTNTWHGSGLEYLRTGQFGARNYFNNEGPKNPFHNNQFGASLGGPIFKDKTFFYLNYEGQRETGAQAGQSCVPDPAVIAQAQANIASWGETINPVTTALLARHPWPTPNIAGAVSDGNGCTDNNVSTAINFLNNINSVIGKVDHNFNPNNLLTGRYYFGDSTQSFPLSLTGSGGQVAGIQHAHPDAGAADLDFVREGGQFQPVERGAPGMEPVCRRIFS